MPEYIESPATGRLAYHHYFGESPGILFCPGFNSDMQGDKALALEAWCRERGRQFTMYPWKRGNFLGSGPGDVCLEQAGMHAEAQWEVIRKFISG